MKIDPLPTNLKLALGVMPVAVAILTIVGNYAIYGYRIEKLETEVKAIQEDRAVRIDDLQKWESTVSTDLATTKNNVEWIKQEMQQRK